MSPNKVTVDLVQNYNSVWDTADNLYYGYL